jgi:hypothetical protein
MSPSAHLRRAAAHGLETRALAPSTPLADDTWRQFCGEAVAHRLTGLLLASVECGDFPTTDAQYETLLSTHVDAMHLALLLESELMEVDRHLSETPIEYRVLKGPAYAHVAYPDPSLRPFGDIDVLVRGDDFKAATSVLEGLGAVRPSPELNRGFDRRFGKGAMFIMPSGLELDLHRTFVFGPFGFRMVPDDLFATSEEFLLGGRRLSALGAEERFLHACYHAALGSPTPRLLTVRDVAQTLLHARLDDVRVLQLSARWEGHAVVASAVNLAWETLELSVEAPLSEWARAYEPDRWEQLAFEAYGADGSYLAQAAASIGSIRGLRSKAAFVASLAGSRAARHPLRSGRRRRIRDAARIVFPGPSR